MSRLFVWAGGLLFAGSLGYFAIRYMGSFGAVIPWTGTGDVWMPVAIDVTLFTAFALHHSVFARLPFRAMVERRVPAGLERPVYVWIASALFIGVCAAWRPVPGLLWHATGAGAALLGAAQLAGFVIVALAARRLDGLVLAGIRDADPASATLIDNGVYGVVRHPIYLGWFLIVWAPATMNGTRLVFALVSCLYLVAAIVYEERDLRRIFGAAYGAYVSRVRWKIVPGVH